MARKTQAKVMHNLSIVVSFEVIRTLKKKSFWLLALSFPLMMIAVGAVMYFSNEATADAEDKMKEAKFSMQVTDESGLINPQLLAQLGAKTTRDRQAGIRAVETGAVDAYYYYPKGVPNEKVQVYAKDVSMFENGKYSAVAQALLEQSVTQTVSPGVTKIIKGGVQFDATMYRDGETYDGFKEMIAPGIFLVLFYFLIAIFGNQMLASTTEEKENRVIEMVLTTIDARTLIIGKVLSLIGLSFVQGLLFIAPALIGYIFFRDTLSIPSFDLSSIPIDPLRIATSAAIFSLSFLLFTGILVAIGAAAPTAKEASSFLGIVLLGLFLPIYASTLYVSAPHGLIVQILTFFPLTSPLPSLIRNAVGNLTPIETIAVLSILGVSATIAMMTAIRIFRYGAIEYSKRLSLTTLLKGRV